MINFFSDLYQQFVQWSALPHGLALWIKNLLILFFIILVSYLLVVIARTLIIYVIRKITQKTKTTFDDWLIRKKVFHRIAYLLPAIFIKHFLPFLSLCNESLDNIVYKIYVLYIVIISIWIVFSFTSAINQYYINRKDSKYHSINQYLQFIKIIAIITAILVMLILMFQINPFKFLGALGAFTAVLLLVFKDPLLGFMASLQILTQDLLRIGDWVTLPKYNVDGTVIEINLVTVKVQNFDKTIMSIPAYTFVSDVFQNWRGMEKSKVRRIKKSILLNAYSIKLCTQKMIKDFEKLTHMPLISSTDYLKQSHHEITYQLNHNITNIEAFRNYMVWYIKNHPEIDTKQNTLLVRHLEMTDKGIPLEIYCFSKVQKWDLYENLQSQIIEHMISLLPIFELQLFQSISNTPSNQKKIVEILKK